MPRILLIDNYDSFTYNLYQMLGSICPEIEVRRNDAIDLRGVRELNPTHIVLSPGPGWPADAGVCEEIIREFAGVIPLLGVCLGHQAICETAGAKITHAREKMHGKQSASSFDANCSLFESLEGENLLVARYHSLAVSEETLPNDLKITARASDGEIMAVQWNRPGSKPGVPCFGTQFHPESILTPQGAKILQNFLAN